LSLFKFYVNYIKINSRFNKLLSNQINKIDITKNKISTQNHKVKPFSFFVRYRSDKNPIIGKMAVVYINTLPVSISLLKI
jgi:hypothetical protein